MTARESFLSFARFAAGPEAERLSTVKKQDRLYLLMKRDPAQVWHLLSWCVVALEEHLSEVPHHQRAPTAVDRGEALIVSSELHDALFAPGVDPQATLEIYGMASYRELLAMRIIKKLDEYRAGKRGEQ